MFVLQGFHSHTQLLVGQAPCLPVPAFSQLSTVSLLPQQPNSDRLDGVTVVDEVAASQFPSKTSHWPSLCAWFRPKPIIFSLSYAQKLVIAKLSVLLSTSPCEGAG